MRLVQQHQTAKHFRIVYKSGGGGGGYAFHHGRHVKSGGNGSITAAQLVILQVANGRWPQQQNNKNK